LTEAARAALRGTGHSHADHAGPDHEHDHDHAHEEAEAALIDPHVWLDPEVMERFVDVVREAMERALEKRGELTDVLRAELEGNARAVRSEVAQVAAEYAKGLEAVERRTIVTHHAAYGWLARRYDLEVAAVIRPIEGVEPTPGAIASAVEAIRSAGVEAIFIEPQFSDRAATRIAEVTGVRVLTLDPIGQHDWPTMMRENLKALREGLGAEVAARE
ncbi:MAG: metal ABC transporter substrate-binding protein, partial [Planctomycetota bacterium]|nr:metal ABC transporter substrate-binding protein [Planctomycetota bacterium]